MLCCRVLREWVYWFVWRFRLCDPVGFVCNGMSSWVEIFCDSGLCGARLEQVFGVEAALKASA